MIRLRLLVDVSVLYLRVAAETIWEDRRIRFWVWVLAVEFIVWRVSEGDLRLVNIVEDIAIGLAISLPFTR